MSLMPILTIGQVEDGEKQEKYHTLVYKLYDEPMGMGLLLADAARTLAKAYVDGGMPVAEETVLSQIKSGFIKELKNPTTEIKGQRPGEPS